MHTLFQTLTLAQNPQPYAKYARKVKSKLQGLTIFSDGEALPVKNLDDPIVIELALDSTQTETFTVDASLYRQIYVNETNLSLVVSLESEADYAECVLLVAANDQPNSTDYDVMNTVEVTSGQDNTLMIDLGQLEEKLDENRTVILSANCSGIF